MAVSRPIPCFSASRLYNSTANLRCKHVLPSFIALMCAILRWRPCVAISSPCVAISSPLYRCYMTRDRLTSQAVTSRNDRKRRWAVGSFAPSVREYHAARRALLQLDSLDAIVRTTAAATGATAVGTTTATRAASIVGAATAATSAPGSARTGIGVGVGDNDDDAARVIGRAGPAGSGSNGGGGSGGGSGGGVGPVSLPRCPSAHPSGGGCHAEGPGSAWVPSAPPAWARFAVGVPDLLTRPTIWQQVRKTDHRRTGAVTYPCTIPLVSILRAALLRLGVLPLLLLL